MSDRRRQQHRNGPVGRFYLWKEWNTPTVVKASSTQTLTLPFSSSHNVLSLPPTLEPLVLLWISKNPTGGFPETHLAISHDERDLTYIANLSDFYSYRFIGKLTTFFQDFSLCKQIVESSTTSAQFFLLCSNLGLEIFSPSLQIYTLRLI